MGQMNLSTKQIGSHIENRLVVAGGRGKGIDGKFGVGR